MRDHFDTLGEPNRTNPAIPTNQHSGNQANPAIATTIAEVQLIREDVLARITKGDVPELREVWLAFGGEDFISATADTGGEEWELLAAEVSDLANTIMSRSDSAA